MYSEAGVNKWLGPQSVQVGSKQDDGDLHGFWNSRRGGVQQVPDLEAERVQRLEQEPKDLGEALTMRQIPGQDPLCVYGAQAFQRVGPPNADPWLSGIDLRQACNDINMRDWVQVNSGNPCLHQHRQSMSGNQLGGGHPFQPGVQRGGLHGEGGQPQQGGQFGDHQQHGPNMVVNIMEVETLYQGISWVEEFKMTGLAKKSSNR